MVFGTWETLDDYAWSTEVRNHPDGIVLSQANGLYVAGGSNQDGSKRGPWLVRRSWDFGHSFSVVDDFRQGAQPAGWAYGLSADPLLVTGCQIPADGTYHAYVRRSVDHGATWSIDDDAGPDTCGRNTVTDASGASYASSYFWDGLQYRWRVRRKAPGATTWVQVDDLAPPVPVGPSGAMPQGIVAANGVVMVSGAWSPNGGAEARWVVRRTTNGGATWATTDDFNDGVACYAQSMAHVPGTTTIYAAGVCAYAATGRHWVVRKSDDLGLTWSTDENWQLEAGKPSKANGLAISSDGAVYAVGSGVDGQRTTWVVRQRVCSP